MKRLFALRGAVRCSNDGADISLRVGRLYDALVVRNGLGEADLVSLVFSVTPDLTAANPAAALRKGGRGGDLPLFCVAEAATEGMPSGIVRALLHCYAEEGSVLRHAYVEGAEFLRPDLAGEKTTPRA